MQITKRVSLFTTIVNVITTVCKICLEILFIIACLQKLFRGGTKMNSQTKFVLNPWIADSNFDWSHAASVISMNFIAAIGKYVEKISSLVLMGIYLESFFVLFVKDSQGRQWLKFQKHFYDQWHISIFQEINV